VNANTQIDLDQLHSAIVTAIAAAFPQFQTVATYPEVSDRQTLATPACIIELTEMEAAPEDDPGTEQLAMVATFEARIIIGFRTPDAKRAIRKLAGALAAFVLRKRWGLPVGPAEVLDARPDDFSPELDQYEVWRVEWQQVIHLGASVWLDSGVTPADIRVSWVPRVGPPYESEYLPVDGEPTA
jgi:hypothetical protein